MKTARERGRDRLAARVAVWVALLVVGGVWSCKDEAPPAPGDTPAKRAANEIKASLPIPEDAKLLDQKVNPSQNLLYFSYSVEAAPAEVAESIKAKIAEKKYLVLEEAGTENIEVGYQDEKQRIVSIAWFARDPEVFKYGTRLRISVRPIPKEIQEDPNL